MEEKRLRLALSIFSGRLQVEQMVTEDFELLGYNSYVFGYFGTPSNDAMKQHCEEIIFSAITKTWQEKGT